MVWLGCVVEEEAKLSCGTCISQLMEATIVVKVLQCSFWWPVLFKDCREYIQTCLKCQKIGNISKKDEMPLNGILEVKPFDYWALTS